MESKLTLACYRQDFESSANRSLSMPLAGAIVWSCVGLASLGLDSTVATYILLFATGAIFPLALAIASLRKEALISSANPLSKLMGLGVLMVNLLWGIHLPLAFSAPEFVSLSLAIGLGLHWIIYSWIINHPLGIVHALLRTFLVVAAWYLFPEVRIFAVSMAVVLAYSISLWQMLTRTMAPL